MGFENARPYLGLSGVTRAAQSASAQRAFGSLAGVRPLMAGFQLSYKSIRGLPMQSLWSKRMLTPERLSELLTHDAHLLNFVHYAPGTKGRETLFADLARVAHESNPLLVDGFQINAPFWVDPDVLRACRRDRARFPRVPQFVIQVNRVALEDAGGTPAGVMARLASYAGLAEYVLFDMSGGRGVPFEPERMLAFLRALRASGLPFLPVVSGGIGPETLPLLDPIFAEFPQASTDMEGACMGKNGVLSLRLIEAAVAGIAAKVAVPV